MKQEKKGWIVIHQMLMLCIAYHAAVSILLAYSGQLYTENDVFN